MENISYKAQRNAKTADEYLLQCLFQAEDERDAAIQEYQDKRDAYGEKLKELDERQKKLDDAVVLEGNEPHFATTPTEGFVCNLETYKYRLSRIETMDRYKELSSAEDDELLEWARKSYRENDWPATCVPLHITEQRYGCFLAYPEGDGIRKFVSKKHCPEEFTEYIDTLTDDIRTDIEQYLTDDNVFDISLKDEVTKLALDELREVIKETIKYMEAQEG